MKSSKTSKSLKSCWRGVGKVRCDAPKGLYLYIHDVRARRLDTRGELRH